MRTIKASVGIHDGKQCYNIVEDQATVIALLNRIPALSGGRMERPLTGKPSWGVCSPDLHSAILAFQRLHHLSVDGHVDPYGTAIRKLNELSSRLPDPGNVAPYIAPDLPWPGPLVEPDAPVLWRVSNLSLSSLAGSAGIGAGAYWGSITFSHPSEGDVSHSMQGNGFSAGESFGIPGEFKSIVASAVQYLLNNFSISKGEWDSATAGICVPVPPWGAELHKNAFAGVCYGGFLSASIGVVGHAGWVLFFGIPYSYADILNYANVLAEAVPIPFALPNAALVANALRQAKGVAFMWSGGLGASLSIGGGANQFIGRIG